MSIERLQKQLGYEFSDERLLTQALTHKSFAKVHNERLEYLGDAVLGYVVAALLFEERAELRENDMSLIRANLVNGEHLASIAGRLEMGAALLLGSGERKSGGRQRDSILADAFEAVIGAVHEDGGIEACLRVIRPLFLKEITIADPKQLKDAKTSLQELLQGHNLELPSYQVEEASGEAHARRYRVSCRIQQLELTTEAEASSRRNAEKAAAAAMLERLEEIDRKTLLSASERTNETP